MIAVLCNVVLLDTLIEGGRLAGGGSGSAAAAGAVPLARHTAGRPACPATERASKGQYHVVR